MSLKAEIQADIAEAFDSDLADAVGPFQIIKEEVGDYDPVTGTTPKQRFTFTGRGVFGSFSQEEIDGQHIISTDIKVTVLQNELVDENGAQAVPEVGFLLINDGQVNNWFRYFFQTYDDYRVEGVMQDPAGATWAIQLRKT